ncbi:MAG: DUF3349 domain-containing protein [Rhodococcus sp.]|nr:DUF3349 domain-containing protein [Rhodococcus sp. (in: high G+C Gram-positive bacteria)]MBJ7321382.1 DUF3349 domain-containing protein [Rhodococcus sp. (in: high G+C Gram-positive bacteria)]
MAFTKVVSTLIEWLRADRPAGPGYIPLLALMGPRTPETDIRATAEVARRRAIDGNDTIALGVTMLEVTGTLATPSDIARIRSYL